MGKILRAMLLPLAVLVFLLVVPGTWLLVPVVGVWAGVRRIRSGKRYGGWIIAATLLLFLIPYLLLILAVLSEPYEPLEGAAAWR
ncbi:hypothetical protein [Paenibacillus mucilaginosus]|nr:hypothetical protein [Paenibacillus mucilaginosus]MCG7212543.1 hypothetical protein [Paenibacillus mucilaginosus]